MPAPPEPKPPEGKIAGKYQVVRLIGRGGMGAVWEGVHDSLGTRVAIKFIDAEYATSDDIRHRFVNEAKAAARLRSKHVVQVYDQGIGEDGRPYIVMEFLAGEPLDARLARLGRLAPEELARIVLHVSRALARAHEHGIVHRDLKPENVFLVHDEEDHMDIAKVVDFGIAKFTGVQGSGSSSTGTGAVLGTPQYMSPEQARGLRTVDHRTDLWSLGVIVYQCLTGSLPFRGEAVGDLLVNICTADAPSPSSVFPGVPSGLDAWMQKALARDPAHRFQSVGELCDSLAAVCGTDTRLGAPTSSTRERAETPATNAATPQNVTGASFSTTNDPGRTRRRPSAAVLAAVFVVVTAGAAVAARGFFRTSANIAPGASAVARSSEAPPRSALAIPDGPEVTPSLTAPPAPSATEEPAEPLPAKARAVAPSKKEKARLAPTPAPAQKPPRRHDELGY